MLLNQKFAVILSLLTALVAVNAAPQFIDFDAILSDAAVATPTQLPVTFTVSATSATVNTASAAAAASSAAAVQDQNPDLASTDGSSDASSGSSDLSKRAALPPGCKAEPSNTQTQPTFSDDTASAFRTDQRFIDAAEAVVPSGYQRIGGSDQYNAAVDSFGWYSYNTLQTYDVNQCASLCDNLSQCLGFNLYNERDPSTDPGNAACQNKNPPSITNIKCILHGYSFTKSNFNNIGQTRGDFETAAAGSVGYLKNSIVGNPPYFPGFKSDNLIAQTCTVNAPLDPVYKNTATGKYVDTFIQSAWFKSPDPASCYSACVAHTKYTLAHDKDGKQSPCNYFTAYQIFKNGNFYQQMCGLYTRDWSDKSNPATSGNICTNFGQYRGSDQYTITQSYDYTINNYSQSYRTDLLSNSGTTPSRGF